MIIRRAELEDLAAITQIYNQAVMNTVATFDTEPKTVETRLSWFNQHDKKYPVLVAVSDNMVIGWVSLSVWSDKCAYSKTAELSIYIEEQQRGKGIGNQLMNSIIVHANKIDCHTIISRIAGESEASIHLHEKYGFELIETKDSSVWGKKLTEEKWSLKLQGNK